jgi:hypothetical protein
MTVRDGTAYDRWLDYGLERGWYGTLHTAAHADASLIWSELERAFLFSCLGAVVYSQYFFWLSPSRNAPRPNLHVFSCLYSY